MEESCIIEECGNPPHAKGYCRRHYGQIWRHGRITNTGKAQQGRFGISTGYTQEAQIRSLERELKRSKQMYEAVVGFAGRMRWRREISIIEADLAKLMEKGRLKDVDSE